jgi:hypothetical protein
VFLVYKTAGAKIENKVYDPFEILGLSAVSIHILLLSHRLGVGFDCEAVWCLGVWNEVLTSCSFPVVYLKRKRASIVQFQGWMEGPWVRTMSNRAGPGIICSHFDDACSMLNKKLTVTRYIQ